MIECIKYDLSDFKNDYWLRNLINFIQLTSEFYYEWFMKNANDDDKSDFKKFWNIARKLHDKKNSSKNEHII